MAVILSSNVRRQHVIIFQLTAVLHQQYLCQFKWASMSKPVLDTCHWGVEVSSSCCRCSINLDTRCLWRAQRSFLDSHNRPTQPIYSSELHLRCTVRQSHIVTPNNFCHQQQQSPQQQTETADSSRNTWFMSENCTMLTFKHRAESEPRHVVPNLNNPFFFYKHISCRRGIVIKKWFVMDVAAAAGILWAVVVCTHHAVEYESRLKQPPAFFFRCVI